MSSCTPTAAEPPSRARAASAPLARALARRRLCWRRSRSPRPAAAVKGADNANLIVGKQQFVAKCGSCHTLARANTKGIVGPNLDEAFRASIAEGLERNTIRGVVEGQIADPQPRRGDAERPRERRDARRTSPPTSPRWPPSPGKDTGLLASAVAAPGAGKPAVEKAGKLQIAASPTGQLAYVDQQGHRDRRRR